MPGAIAAEAGGAAPAGNENGAAAGAAPVMLRNNTGSACF